MNNINPRTGKPVNVERGVQGFVAKKKDETETDANLVPADSPVARALAVIEENRGRFENGYDDDDITRFSRELGGVGFATLWEYRDEDGFGGASEFIVRDNADGPWKRIHPDVFAYLVGDEDAGENLSHLTTLESDDVVTELTDDMIGDLSVSANVTADDALICRADGCNERNDDGEGWDGWCGNCADIVTQHEEGDHEDEPRGDCPECY